MINENQQRILDAKIERFEGMINIARHKGLNLFADRLETVKIAFEAVSDMGKWQDASDKLISLKVDCHSYFEICLGLWYIPVFKMSEISILSNNRVRIALVDYRKPVDSKELVVDIFSPSNLPLRQFSEMHRIFCEHIANYVRVYEFSIKYDTETLTHATNSLMNVSYYKSTPVKTLPMP